VWIAFAVLPVTTNATRPVRRPLIVVCIMLSLFMSAIEVTIVATAMPQIVRDLGGFAYYSWVFSAFLLTQTATTVIFGKLADIYGRKPVIIAGTVIFLTGSVLCGFAWSMGSMIAFRLLQGIGAGSMQPIAVTIAGDFYVGRERLRMQGALSAVWAGAAMIGPLVGGVLVESLSWSWIFWVNVPIGILTILGFVFFMHEDVAHREHRIDYLGAALFSVSVGAFLVALTQSATLSWTEILLLAAVAALTGLLFLLVERSAPEPMIALDLWGSRLLASANGSLLCGMMALAGVTSYLPMYFQGVLGYSAIYAGFPLMVMMVTWPMASATSGTILRYLSMRATLRLGSFMIPAGALFLLFLKPGTTLIVAGIGPALMGFGMGLLNITSVIMVQGTIEWSKRASATAALIFSRTLGNTLGVAALGAVLNFGIVLFAAAQGESELTTPDHVRELLAMIGDVAGGAADPSLRPVLDAALHLAFWVMLGFAAITALLSLSIPTRELETLTRSSREPEKAQAE
jgi:EmrB/QacA subfamily drug resistance transporter